MPTPDANDHPTQPRPRATARLTPGTAFWLLSTLAIPASGVVLTVAVSAALGQDNLSVGSAAAFLGALGVTVFVLPRLPRLRLMTRRRRISYLALSVLLQVILGYALAFAALIVLVVVACMSGHCLS